MEVEFAFRKEKSLIFGEVPRPVASITLINGNIESNEIVYVDSGADITLIARSVGEYLGFKIEANDKIEEIKGIGGKSIPIIIKVLTVKIGKFEKNARVAWGLIEDVPLLLGRLDLFELFEIIFKENKSTIFKW